MECGEKTLQNWFTWVLQWVLYQFLCNGRYAIYNKGCNDCKSSKRFLCPIYMGNEWIGLSWTFQRFPNWVPLQHSRSPVIDRCCLRCEEVWHGPWRLKSCCLIILLLMEEILHHLGWIKPCTWWNIYDFSLCRISSIKSSKPRTKTCGGCPKFFLLETAILSQKKIYFSQTFAILTKNFRGALCWIVSGNFC